MKEMVTSLTFSKTPESGLFTLDLKLAAGLYPGSSAVSLLMSHDTWRLAGLEPILDSSASVSVRHCRATGRALVFILSPHERWLQGDLQLTDSLSEAEERRDLLCRLNWPLVSDVWLVTVERRIDMKLLLVERSSWGLMQSKKARHGMYLAKANLQRGNSSAYLSIRAS